jgi:hypothetical protein
MILPLLQGYRVAAACASLGLEMGRVNWGQIRNWTERHSRLAGFNELLSLEESHIKYIERGGGGGGWLALALMSTASRELWRYPDAVISEVNLSESVAGICTKGRRDVRAHGFAR